MDADSDPRWHALVAPVAGQTRCFRCTSWGTLDRWNEIDASYHPRALVDGGSTAHNFLYYTHGEHYGDLRTDQSQGRGGLRTLDLTRSPGAGSTRNVDASGSFSLFDSVAQRLFYHAERDLDAQRLAGS